MGSKPKPGKVRANGSKKRTKPPNQIRGFTDSGGTHDVEAFSIQCDDSSPALLMRQASEAIFSPNTKHADGDVVCLATAEKPFTSGGAAIGRAYDFGRTVAIVEDSWNRGPIVRLFRKNRIARIAVLVQTRLQVWHGEAYKRADASDQQPGGGIRITNGRGFNRHIEREARMFGDTCAQQTMDLFVRCGAPAFILEEPILPRNEAPLQYALKKIGAGTAGDAWAAPK